MNLLVPPKQKNEIRGKLLPEMVRVRFVRVELDTGENEILVTNLLQETYGSSRTCVGKFISFRAYT